jgi:hypothetical protein
MDITQFNLFSTLRPLVVGLTLLASSFVLAQGPAASADITPSTQQATTAPASADTTANTPQAPTAVKPPNISQGNIAPAYEYTSNPLLRIKKIRGEGPNFKWPDIALNLLSSDLMAVDVSASNSTVKTDLSDAAKKTCAKILEKYQQFFENETQVTDYGIYFSTVCEQVAVDIEHEQYLHDPKFAKAIQTELPAVILGQLDLTYFNYMVSYTKNLTVKFEKQQKSYEKSLLGRIGISYPASFITMQIIQIISLLLALAAFVKSFFLN